MSRKMCVKSLLMPTSTAVLRIPYVNDFNLLVTQVLFRAPGASFRRASRMVLDAWKQSSLRLAFVIQIE